jgi:FkbM family methyltransferase
MKNYSQNKEQDAILNYFGDYVGIFCDIGANDGITISNTYALLQRGWHGTYIEASWLAFNKLRDNLQPYVDSHKAILLNCAVAGKSGTLEFHESGPQLGPNDVSLVSSLYESEIERFKKTVKYTKTTVDALTWDNCLYQNQTFDFISMDIEGAELEVLPQIDLTHVRAFCIEWNSKPELKKEYDKYFGGFKIIYTSGENLIYAR